MLTTLVMIKNFTLFLIVLFMFIPHLTEAQKRDFGDISKQMIEMDVYEKDSTASAIVLFDVGEVFIDEELEVNFKRHVRIKILTDKGLEEGNISIPYRVVDAEQDINGIKAESYYLDDNGKVRKSKLGRRDKFKNEISEGWEEIKFTIPGLRKGSIFEYEYKMKSESPYDIPDWYFQSNIPVVWSEYTLFIPEWYTYLPYSRSYHDFHISDRERYQDNATIDYTVVSDNDIYTARTKEYRSQRIDYYGTKFHFVMKDVPAIKFEPYMKARVDYLAQIRFQLASIQFPGDLPTFVLKDWQSLVEAFEQAQTFGKRLSSSRILKENALAQITDTTSDMNKMINIYDHVRKSIKWDGYYDLFFEEDLDEIYQTGTASSSQINMILAQMLREVDLKADPVVLSTRDNGEIIDIYPITDQFNHTIVKVDINGNYYLLDATDEDRPYTMLPLSDINGKGLVIQKSGKVQWVPLINRFKNSIVSLVNLKVENSGKVTGVIESKNNGFFAYNYEDAFSNSDEQKVGDLVFTNTDDLKIDSISYSHNSEIEQISYKVNFSKSLSQSENNIYFNPTIIEAITENPFKLKQRKYPVDFNYTQNKTIITSVLLPEGWEIDEFPKSIVYKSSDGKIFYRRIIQALGNTISIRNDFIINKERFMPEQYDEIRYLYDQIVNENSKLIVLKKSES